MSCKFLFLNPYFHTAPPPPPTHTHTNTHTYTHTSTLILFYTLLRVKRMTSNSTNPYFILAKSRTFFFNYFQALMMKKLSYMYYNKRITTRDKGNNQSHNQKESNLNSTISAKHAHTPTHDKVIKKFHSIRIM